MLIEPIVEGGGLVIALALLWYYQVHLPGRAAAREREDRAKQAEPPAGG